MPTSVWPTSTCSAAWRRRCDLGDVLAGTSRWRRPSSRGRRASGSFPGRTGCGPWSRSSAMHPAGWWPSWRELEAGGRLPAGGRRLGAGTEHHDAGGGRRRGGAGRRLPSQPRWPMPTPRSTGSAAWPARPGFWRSSTRRLRPPRPATSWSASPRPAGSSSGRSSRAWATSGPILTSRCPSGSAGRSWLPIRTRLRHAVSDDSPAT